MEESILKKYNDNADLLIAKVMRYVIGVTCFVYVLTECGIFIIDKKVILALVLLSVLIGLIPTLLFTVFKIHKPWAGYFVLSSVIFYIGILYSFLSYHVPMMFVFPVLLSCLYIKKRYSFFVIIVSVPTLIISHLFALHLKIVPDEPLVSLIGVINYGIIPRTLEFLICSIICIAIATRTQRLIMQILENAHSQERNKDRLHQFILDSELLLTARNYREAETLLMESLQNMTKMLGIDNTNATFEAGYCLDHTKKRMYLLYEKTNQGSRTEVTKTLTEEDTLSSELDWIRTPYRDISITKTECLFQFYSKDKLLAYTKIKAPFDTENSDIIDMLHLTYNNAAKILLNIELNFSMHQTQMRLVHSLAAISESKSKQTGQHIKRVGGYMKLIGKELGLSEDECETLSMAAMLHDVGKMSIPGEILDKPGKLTKEEFEVIKSHVVSGRTLLEGCPGDMMEIGKEIAYQHHEKWDGTGYLGKKGEEIYPYARYVAVIDVFDALISRRSYKEAWPMHMAFDEIIRYRGTHFAPEAVDLFEKVFPEIIKIAQSYPDEME